MYLILSHQKEKFYKGKDIAFILKLVDVCKDAVLMASRQKSVIFAQIY
jgi:hypothetical protein